MTWKIIGVTRNNSGTVLGSCECFLLKYNSSTGIFTQTGAKVTSDPTTGAYAFTGLTDNASLYSVAAYKSGSPNVMDVTDRNLTPVVETVAGVAWDPAHKDSFVTLSNSNFTMAGNDNINGGGTRSTTSKSTGKFLFEFHIDSAGAGNGYNGVIGVCTAAQAMDGGSVLLPQGNRSMLITAGVSVINGSTGGAISSGATPSGQYIAMAIDLTAGLMWFKGTDAGSWSGLWNGGTSAANVDAGIGGISFTSAGPYFIYAAGIGTGYGGAPSLGVTLNTAGSFVNTGLPTTFGTWT